MSDSPILWTVACQASLSTGFSRQDYWSGLSFLPPRDLPDPGIKLMSLMSPALAGRFFTTSATWETPLHLGLLVVYVILLLHSWEFPDSRHIIPVSCPESLLWTHPDLPKCFCPTEESRQPSSVISSLAMTSTGF